MPDVVGVGVSPGRAAGPLVRMPDPLPEPADGSTLIDGADTRVEAARIDAAAERVTADLDERAQHAQGDGKAVLEATALMAADPTFVAAAKKLVSDGKTPERAVWEAASAVAKTLEELGGYMAERARDIADVRDRIVAELTGRPAPGVPEMAEPFVLVAVDLAPADTATLDPKTCVALVTAEGGPTSHTAILARSLGIPAVVAAPEIVDVAEGTVVLVDGAAGVIHPNPSDDEIAKAKAAASRIRVFKGKGVTADGFHVQLLANVGDAASAEEGAAAGAEGVGLFRTEFCFLDRTDEPPVDEQAEMYASVFRHFTGKKVVVRTLDAGADKPLPFLTDASEANPALGVRGYRTVERSPEVVEHQLDAIAKAAGETDAEVWVMAPMIATVNESETFVASCHKRGLDHAGVMIEVPAAALSSKAILKHASFASIGTNDLTQYTMAADRLLGDLAKLNDPWQPAALRLIQFAGDASANSGKPLGVCGEAAADPALAVVLVGLGASSLSMTPRALADVAAVLETVTHDQCARLAELAVDADNAVAARLSVRSELPVLEELGL